jgi:hypothetical protein
VSSEQPAKRETGPRAHWWGGPPCDDGLGMTQVRYWAAAKDAAGTAEDAVQASTLAEALAQARTLHPGRLEQVLGRCSFIVDGSPPERRPR